MDIFQIIEAAKEITGPQALVSGLVFTVAVAGVRAVKWYKDALRSIDDHLDYPDSVESRNPKDKAKTPLSHSPS